MQSPGLIDAEIYYFLMQRGGIAKYVTIVKEASDVTRVMASLTWLVDRGIVKSFNHDGYSYYSIIG